MNTFLLMSSHTDEVNISKWLIEYGADINHKDENGRTPLMEAVSQGKLKK